MKKQLTYFIFLLMRDDVPLGRIANIVKEVEKLRGDTPQFDTAPAGKKLWEAAEIFAREVICDDPGR